MEQQWPGFSPISVTMSPGQPKFEFSQCVRASGDNDQPVSPLVFMRTPGINGQEDACPDSSKRFSAWLQNTSPYTGGSKTPPTVSMKSMAAGAENTPPPQANMADKGRSSAGSQQHFQAWLSATNSTRWTPRKSPAAGTPPPAPAPSPAGTPMSIMRDITHSAATPPTSTRLRQLQQGPQQQPQVPAAAGAAGGDGFDTSEDEGNDAGEASTTIGAAQLAAAADRAVGLRAQGGSMAQQVRSTPPRVPAPSPTINSPVALGQQQQSLLQAATDRMMHSSLLTPMSNLSISKRAQAQRTGCPDNSVTPPVSRSTSRAPGAEAAAAASPAEKLIGLMLSPAGGESRRRQHHHHQHPDQQQQQTPSRLSAAMGAAHDAHAPLSPNLQVIDLMMQPGGSSSTSAAAAGASSTDSHAVAAAAGAAQEEADADAEFGSCNSSYGSGSETESGDELDLSELQALCGEAALAPDTPLSMILGMMITPDAAAGLTPQLGAEQQQGSNADIGPRVLFADD